jgi:hypothetical protein
MGASRSVILGGGNLEVAAVLKSRKPHRPVCGTRTSSTSRCILIVMDLLFLDPLCSLSPAKAEDNTLAHGFHGGDHRN